MFLGRCINNPTIFRTRGVLRAPVYSEHCQTSAMNCSAT